MFQRRARLFTILGFEVKVDISWLILAVLITWTLARGLFPYYYKNLPAATYWWMGIAGTLGLFLAIVFHELSHSLVARKHGLPMKGITLFIFGGLAEMSDEPPTPKAELRMAIAGPLASIALGLFFFLIRVLGKNAAWPVPVVGVVSYLAVINFILAGFNLLPAFPLDGGRVLRSILWRWKNNIRWATRVSSRIGSGFGMLLIFLGALRFIFGDFIGGAWMFLIGMFLRGASRMSYRQVLMRKALEGEKVARFMNDNPVTVEPSITLEELVNDYIYRHHFKMYPVVENGKVLGCVTTKQIKEISREDWANRRVGEMVEGCSNENSISPDTDAVKALTVMSKSRNSRLMVVEGDRLVGIITLKDLLGFLSVKLDLEGEEGEAAGLIGASGG